MRPDNRHPSHKVAADLRAQIMAGLLAPGEKLASTAQLAERYGTHGNVVQNAQRILKDEGIVYGQTGKGVYVREDFRLIIQADAYIAPSPSGITYRILDVAEVEPPADVSAALGEDRAVCRTRLMLHGDAPVELSRSYYPASWAAGTPLAGRGKIRGGAPAVLAELGYPQREWTDRISTRPPVVEEAELLDVPEGVPVFRQFRVIRSDGGRVAEVTVMVKPGHRYELEYRQVVADKG